MCKRKCILAILCTGIIVFSVGCSALIQTVPELIEPEDAKMSSYTVERRDIFDVDVYPAVVTPEITPVYFTEDGIVEEKITWIGESVVQGQVMLTTNQQEYEQNIKKLEDEIAYTSKNNSYENKKMEYELAMLELTVQKLKQTDTNEVEILETEQKMEQLTLQLKQTKEDQEYRIKQLQSKLEEQKHLLVGTQLKAPRSGEVVYAQAVIKGNQIKAYEPIYYIADNTSLTIQSEYIQTVVIKNAKRIEARIGDELYEVTNVPYEEEEYKKLILSEKTLKSFFKVNSGEIESGQVASVCLYYNYKEQVLAIPKQAVLYDDQGKYIYKIVDGKRIRQSIKTGITTKLYYEVTSGIEEGDQVYVKE